MKKTRVLSILLIVFLLSPHAYEGVLRNIGMMLFVRHFMTPTIFPHEGYLKRVTYAFDALVKLNPDRYQGYRERADAVLRRSESSEYARYRQSRLGLYAAQQAHLKGDLEFAIAAYREVISSGSDQMRLEASIWLAGLLWQIGDIAGFESLMEQTSRLPLPHWMNAVDFSDVRLLGGYVDSYAFGFRQPVHLVMVWQIMPEMQSASELDLRDGIWMNRDYDSILLRWRDRVYQAAVIENLIGDGSFESNLLPREGAVVQLPLSLYGETRNLQDTALVYEPPTDAENIVLRLRGPEGTISGLSSDSLTLPNDPCVAYLVTGRYRSGSDSQPRIGARWLLRTARSWNDNVSTYIVDIASVEWVEFTGLLLPPKDAEGVQLWVMNINSAGDLEVDDLGLFAVTLPCLALEQ